MKQIAFISGKGGTGKSTVVSSLSMLVNNKIIADCDVDAPNLHILLEGELLEKKDYMGAQEATIDSDKCISCGRCIDACKFDAIDDDFKVISMKCEGCGVCRIVCPADAVSLDFVKTGETYVTNTEYGTFSHALLNIGAEGSGKLVTEVRKNLKSLVKDEEWILIDGSPGIGCVVIASITGADSVVIVSEPTKSGLSDLKRVLGVVKHFGLPALTIINKYNLNEEISREIEDYCNENDAKVIGKIPFDPAVVKALQEFKTPIEAKNREITKEMKNIWENIKKIIS